MNALSPNVLNSQQRAEALLGHIVQPLVTVAPLVLGGLIYILFRPASLFMFDWFDRIGASSIIAELRTASHSLLTYFPDWAVYSFPQAAWVWFGTMLFLRIWEPSHSFVGRFWVFVPCLLAVGGEAAQWFHVVRGTFDAIDVFFSLLALLAALWFHHCFLKHHRR